MAVMMPYKFSSLYSELEVPRQRRPSIRLPSFWNIWNSRPCFKAKFSAAFDSFISDRRTFSPFWWWDKSFWQIIWQFDKFRFKMEEKRARLFKLISGKGGQPSAERLKIQKDLFGFSRVSQTFMIRCLRRSFWMMLSFIYTWLLFSILTCHFDKTFKGNSFLFPLALKVLYFN